MWLRLCHCRQIGSGAEPRRAEATGRRKARASNPRFDEGAASLPRLRLPAGPLFFAVFFAAPAVEPRLCDLTLPSLG